MSGNDKHSVLLHFTGEYKELYDNIRKKAMELQLPISTYMRLLLKANINTNIGMMEVYESSTKSGKDAQGKMDNQSEFLRKQLSNKYNDLNTDGFE